MSGYLICDHCGHYWRSQDPAYEIAYGECERCHSTILWSRRTLTEAQGASVLHMAARANRERTP